ncbi:Lsr2 family DNA-binding protein [Streptomyces sp. bgisy154]|uniref:Lsr2 family DNA-binding protein n=1 Tax=Streptomyces sp. bgisy154 TaxID=3413794 RepID=UPI003D71ECB4
MTIAALRRLLDEIDTQGGPEAARQGRLHLPDTPQEGPHPVAQPVPQLASTPEPPAIPLGQLLKWGDDHDDPDVRDQATRARVALTGLRRRHAADAELAAITNEAAELEQRLAELRTRQAELAPPKRPRRASPSYDAATVRTWAQQTGVDCPTRGRIPKSVLDAWRTATQNTT